MDKLDPRQQLAERLRTLREECWPDRKITQPQLARALGGSKPLSVPLISSWESQTNPRIPPLSRLESYAAVFATSRSFEDGEPRQLSPGEMTDEERQVMSGLSQELHQLRRDALRAGTSAMEASVVGQGPTVERAEIGGPWRFDDGNTITIVCAQWPEHMLKEIPHTNVDYPDYVELLAYSDLDALFELHGHLRAANPLSQVNLRTAGRLKSDDYSSHLVSLGGVDWNTTTSTALKRLPLPVRAIEDWGIPEGQYFEVDADGITSRYQPVLEKVDTEPKGILREDVALFAKAISPFNREASITICNGIYGRGTYGVVRALTDARFRDRNSEYIRSRFGSSEAYCILTRIPIVDGATLTPDWAIGDYTLFEWCTPP